jgi:hypothetical protein
MVLNNPQNLQANLQDLKHHKAPTQKIPARPFREILREIIAL